MAGMVVSVDEESGKGTRKEVEGEQAGEEGRGVVGGGLGGGGPAAADSRGCHDEAAARWVRDGAVGGDCCCCCCCGVCGGGGGRNGGGGGGGFVLFLVAVVLVTTGTVPGQVPMAMMEVMMARGEET